MNISINLQVSRQRSEPYGTIRRKQWGRPSASFSDIFVPVPHIMKMSEMRKISLLAGALNTLNL